MTKVISVQTIDELRRFLNEKGILEIALRGENKKFKTFQKISLDQLQQSEVSEKLQQAMNILNKNNQIVNQSMDMLINISKLSKLNLVLSGMNLCATCAGFAIMYKKLDAMSSQISNVIAVYKKGAAIHADYEFNKILSEHSNMLDCRKKQSYYTENQMRELVDGEYNVLVLLINIFLADISSNREELVFSILSLAQMLSVSIRYFDEIYYFENKEAIGDGDRWHIEHDKWMAAFDKMTANTFIERIQDQGIFEMGLNTVETDCYYINFVDQIRSLKQDVEDNQKMIMAIDDEDLFRAALNTSNENVKSEIEHALEEAGVPVDKCEDMIRVAVA